VVFNIHRSDQGLKGRRPDAAALVRILITGGLGYLGGRLAQLLASCGTHQLRLATRRAGGNAPSAAGDEIVTVEWSDERSLARACEGIETIVHLAGMSAAACARDPVAALEFNGVGTARLWRAAARQRVRRIIGLSTAHIYGTSLEGEVDELTLPRPRHPYGSSRLAAEHATQVACLTYGLEAVIVRLSNAFGAPVDPGVDCWSLVCNDLCRQAVATGHARLKSDGTQRRDFIPIGEACRAVAHLLELPVVALGEGVFNVGGSWAPSLLEMARLIAQRVELRLGCAVQVMPGSARDSVGSMPLSFSVARLYGSGFTPRPSAVTQELDQLVDYCVRHPQT
jgi:UDP-glucose 4-epimerase